MANLAQRLANLSVEQRRLLHSRLSSVDMSAARQDEGRSNYPLSFAQQRLWVLKAIQENDATYLVPGALRLIGRLDIAAFEYSVDAIVARHASLRTIFETVAGEARQRVLDDRDVLVACPVIDLSSHSCAEREDKARALIEEEMRRPFDLSKASLLRVMIIDMGGADRDEHIVVFTMHHIVSDGWSAQVLVREFAALYEARLAERDAVLPALPIQYVDYAVWQRDWLDGDMLDRQLAFWRDALDGASFALEVPTDRVRPPIQDNAGRTLTFGVPAALAERLRELARANGATLYMMLLAAYFILLSRWSGQSDICVGTPVANRRRIEHEGVIGFFVNTLVMRGDLSGDPNFLVFLSRARDICLRAQEHQDLPFERLVEALAPARDLSRTPLFQTMFSVQSAPTRGFSLPGMTIEPYAAECGTAKFDLSFELAEESDGSLHGEAEFATALFDHATVERMIAHYVRLLGSIVASPSARIGDLAMLSPDERDLLLRGFNATDIDFSNTSIVDLFASRTRRSPDAIALCCKGESITYRDVDRRSNRLARELIDLGAGPETIIGLCLERSVDLIVSLLAILKSGAAYLPLDPDYPEARLAYMIEDASPLLTISRASLQTRLPTAFLLPIDGAEASAAIDARSEAPLALRALPQNIAYVIYTSGSTGCPKGVAVAQASLANLVRGQIDNYGLDPSDRVLQLASPSFDLSVEEIFPALCGGATLVLSPGSFADSWPAFHALIDDNAITFVSAPTAVWRHYTHWLAETGALAPASLEQLSTGTEAADAATLSLWRKCAPHAQWINAYGPTETTVTATAWRFADDATALVDVPIGAPLANVKAYILDRRFEPVALGVVGEIYIGGAGVARGYLNRPDLTAEKFIPDPYGPPGARLYRTGDLGRRRADGLILFVGRVDEQVKVRGYRIEPGEIETALARLSHIRAAAVVTRDDANGDKRLVAFVATDDTSAFNADATRAALRAALPDYMVPATIVALKALPLNANGKIDRGALPCADVECAASDYVAPRNGVEEIICRVWAEILGRPQIGATDNFFEAGGHSLLALRAVDALQRAGLTAEARTIFAAPTPEQFARALNDRETRAAPPNGIPSDCASITPEMVTLAALTQDEIERVVATTPGGARNIADIYPLAPLQEGILFHHLMTSEGDPYLSPMQFDFASRDRLDSFVAALRALVAPHDVLRTAIAYEQLAEPVQIVWREANLDLHELPPMTADEMRNRFHSAHYRLDIRVAPLMQLFASQDPRNGRWLLMLLVHHLVLDHATTERLLDQLRKTLAGVAMTERPAPYRNFVAQTRLGQSRAEHETFFRAMLADVSEPTVPLALTDAHGDGSRNIAAVLPLGATLSQRLRAAARKLGVSAASIFHVAFAQLLARLSGRDDIVFGTVMFGRMNGTTANGLGMYINTLPFRSKLEGMGAERAVRLAQQDLTALLAHEHASLALAQRCSGVRQPAPLFTALLNYRHSVDESEAQDGSFMLAEGMELIFAEERSNYPFDLSIDDFGDRFSIELQSPQEAGPERICLEMQTAVEGLVEALEQAPDRPVLDIDILPHADRIQLLHGFNSSRADFPQNISVADLFTAQARRTPDVVALSCAGKTLDYGELDRRANRLARVLIAHGAGPDRLIGLSVERSIEMIVSLLAILKSGAGYLPLDPDYPPARLALLIEQAKPLLTLASASLQQRLPATSPRLVIDGSEMDVLVRSQPDTSLPPRASPQNIAYVIYTSGSTGTPKGVAITHANLANLTQGQIAFHNFGGLDRLLQLASLGFDMSVEEIFPALCSGATLVVSPERLPDSWPAFQSLIDDNAVTFINPPTAVWRHYARWLAETGERPPRSLRALSTGGEAVDAATLRLWRDVAPGIDFTNGYGPTETTVNAAAWRLNENVETLADVPIGRPVANARIYLLDRRLEPAPIGVAGEIFIGGEGVARGYIGRPDLTAESFVPDPYGPPGARLYRTGDLARRRADGALVFIGRADNQVKIRGFRIELGEIESALAGLANIRAASVIARDDANGDKRLVAFVETDDPPAFDANAARMALRGALPDYMVPTAIIALAQLPLNASGKIDRKALPDMGAPQDRVDFAPPETDTERALCEAWSRALGVDPVSALDNFFELGGHSLAVMQMATRLSRTLSMNIPLVLVYQTDSLRELARAIDAAKALRTPAQTTPDDEFEEFEL